MSLTQPMRLTLFLLSGVFVVLGGLFVVRPEPAAAFYGLPISATTSSLYVGAVGLRDLALAAYLFGLTLANQRRGLWIVLAGTILIPVGDILLLAASGAGQTAHYLLHGASLICFVALVLWIRPRAPTPQGSIRES